MKSHSVLTEGLIEKIGMGNGGEGDGEIEGPRDHAEALEQVDAAIHEVLGDRELDAVGHRVVHGGERFGEPVLIDNDITRAIERLTAGPAAQPCERAGHPRHAKKWPDMPQVAVFDTAFHRTLPEHAWRYALPYSLYTNHGIRRYGFHGTSHDYVAHQAAALLDLPVEEFDVVIAHLGNGATVTAIRGGKSVDTSMGFTPLEGLVMGTRSGDLDPSILVFLGRAGWSTEDIDSLLNRESGLKGLAGNNDMRSVVEASEAGDARAATALAVASYRLAKYIGGYHVAVGGAKALVFTAGIGENSHQFRTLVGEKLGALGIELDAGLNSERSKEPRVISTAESLIPVLVVPTDEERAIAEATAAVVDSQGASD